MNIRRGLIRLWVFASVIWIASIGAVAVSDPDVLPAAEAENPYAKYVAAPDPATDEDDPYAKYVAAPDPATEKKAKPAKAAPRADGLIPVEGDPFADEKKAKPDNMVMSGIKGAAAAHSPPSNSNAGKFRSAIWKYAGVALGVPIIVLIFGAGAGWVAIGFKADAGPQTKSSGEGKSTK
jgi:hypothetical protein